MGSTGQNVNEANKFKDSQDAKASDLLSPVCCFTVSSETTPTNEKPNNFPPTISVIINPPSPSMSIESQHDSDVEYKMNPYLRRHIGESMEKCKLMFYILNNLNNYVQISMYYYYICACALLNLIIVIQVIKNYYIIVNILF